MRADFGCFFWEKRATQRRNLAKSQLPGFIQLRVALGRHFNESVIAAPFNRPQDGWLVCLAHQSLRPKEAQRYGGAPRLWG